MKSKRKLIISMLAVMFVLLAIIATVAITFALTQQTIKTTLNISYTVEDIDGSVYATYSLGGETAYLEPQADTDHISADGNSLLFKATDTENAGNLIFPNEALNLTKDNNNVVIKYTYKNTGGKHYIASMSFDADLKYENMTVEYGIWDFENNKIKYSEDRYALVVPSGEELSYWIKISITNVAKNAEFEGDFSWLLNGCDKDTLGYESLTSLEFQSTGTAGEYSAAVSSSGAYVGELIFPREVNGDEVTKIVASTLSDEQKATVTSVYIPDSVTTIGDSAFESFTNMETVTFEQNETAGASAQAVSALKTINNKVFRYCSSLKEIVIPSTVTALGQHAFVNCVNLTKVEIFGNIPTIRTSIFSGCVSLKSVNIPDSVTLIQPNAFSGCSSLPNIVLGAKVKTIQKQAFRNCSSLSSFTTNEVLTTIAEEAFRNCKKLSSIVLPNSLTTLEKNAFLDCENLESVSIGTGLTTIPYCCFSGCTALDNLVIPNNVTIIDYGAFGHTGITTLTIPNSVTSIGYGAFAYCYNLKTISIPQNLTSIGEFAFRECSALESIQVDSNNIAYKSEGNCLIDIATKTLIQGCNTSVIPNGVEIINGYTFVNCKGLTNLVIPASVKKIGSRAFIGCVNVTSVTLNEGLVEIQSHAFKDNNITTITIPSTVEIIRAYAFEGTKISTVVIPENVYIVGKYAFDTNNITSVEFKNTTGWYLGEGVESTVEEGTSVDVSNPTNNALIMNNENAEMTYLTKPIYT